LIITLSWRGSRLIERRKGSANAAFYISINRETNMNQPNGKPAGVTSEQLAAAHQALATITPIIRPSVQTLVRGLLMSCPGMPPHAVMCVAASEMAHFMGQCFQGDLAQIAAVRNQIKAAFEEGMSKAPLLQPAGSSWAPPPGEKIGPLGD
jgi:hypothetical protein